MSVLIGHASISENNSINGSKGDSTGKEVCTRTWYSKPWDYMAIHPDATVREKHAEAIEAACANNNIGYGQSDRNTANTESKKVNYDISKIKTKCNTDCSALQNLAAVASGAPKVTYGSNGWTTSTMKSFLRAAGYKIITDKTILASADYCVRGAIYVKSGSHTVCGLTNGVKYATTLSKAGIVSNNTNTSATASTSTRRYSVGQTVTYSSCYKSSTDGIDKAIMRNPYRTGVITKVLATNVNNPYLIGNGTCWVNDGDIRSVVTNSSASTNPVQSISQTKVTYMSHCIGNGKWCSEITGYNTTDFNGYSGILGKTIDKFAVKLSQGTITYMAHKKGGSWFEEVSGYSTTNPNAYAGATGKAIDAIAIKASGIAGTLKYRVHTKADNRWWPWVTGYSKTNPAQYAGVFGKEIDAIQIGIE